MGSDAPQASAPAETAESKELTRMNVERAKYMQPLEKAAMTQLMPAQTDYQLSQYEAQQRMLPYEEQLRISEAGTAAERSGVTSDLLGGNLPPQYQGLMEPTSPVNLTGPDYDQAYSSARDRLMDQEGRRNEGLLAQQNVAGVLGSGGTHEMLRRSGEQTDMSLADLATQQMMDETNRLNQQGLLGREDEMNLLGRQGGLLNLGMGAAPYSGGQVGTPTTDTLGAAQQGIGQAGQYVSQQNALQSQNTLAAQQLAMQGYASQNAFYGDMFGGLLGAVGMGAGVYGAFK